MLSEFRIKKLTRMFNLNDVDQNGFTEQADWEMIINATTQAVGYTLDSPEYRAYYDDYMGACNTLLALGDSDQDRRLSLAEYLVGWDKLMTDPESFDRVIRTLNKTMITMWDSNQDGKVSREEYCAFAVAYNTTEAEADEAFRRLDRNGDGYITLDELVQTMVEFFYSDDPAAPGNWSLGPLE